MTIKLSTWIDLRVAGASDLGLDVQVAKCILYEVDAMNFPFREDITQQPVKGDSLEEDETRRRRIAGGGAPPPTLSRTVGAPEYRESIAF